MPKRGIVVNGVVTEKLWQSASLLAFLTETTMVMSHGSVLIIEDDQQTGETLAAALAAEGFGIRWVKTRNDGIAALDRNLYHIILMDFDAAGMSFPDFLKGLEGKSNAVIILMSATPDSAAKASTAALTYLIEKPVPMPELLAIILRALA
jgi:DNA-binding response OmpR family regulator